MPRGTPPGSPAASARSRLSAACASRPESTISPIGPSITSSQKRRRASGSAKRRLESARKRAARLARRPKANGTSASIMLRSLRASTGDAPPVEIAICSGGRSTSEGMMKLDSPASSATLTGTCSALAACETDSLTAASSVAAITISAPTRSPGWKRLGSWRSAPCRVSSDSRAHSSGAITVSRAPERSSASAFCAATAPPPTTTPGLPRRSRKAAK